MKTLVQAITPWRLIMEEAPSFVPSLVIAEFLFKFHSFTLECLAFLFTWGVLSKAANWVRTAPGLKGRGNS